MSVRSPPRKPSTLHVHLFAFDRGLDAQHHDDRIRLARLAHGVFAQQSLGETAGDHSNLADA